MEHKYRVLEGKSGVREVYDQMADCYDYSNYLYWTRKMEEGEERVVRRWVGRVRSPVLDVGCGTGRYAIEKAIGFSEVVALDISRGMLNKTVEKAKKNKCYQNVYPVLADGEHLPFKDGSFNGLICTLTFDHFQNCELTASEFSRVLESNGLCILTTFNTHTLDDCKKRLNVPKDKMPFQTENMPPTLVYEVGHSANEIKKIFAKYGFDMTEVKGCCYWHLLPMFLTRYYKLLFDPLFNTFKFLLKYAEIHVTIMKKREPPSRNRAPSL